jgi:hypothetical protein
MDPVQFKGREPAEIKIAQEKKKEEKKAPPVKVKKYYDIKLDAMVPCTITYRVFAFDEHEALTLLPRAIPNNVKHNLHQKRNIKAIINDAGSSLIRLIKNFK